MRKAKLVVTFEHAPSYEVRIGGSVLNDLGCDIARNVSSDREVSSRILLLAGANVDKAVIDKAKAALRQAGYRTVVITVSPDDALATAAELWRALAQTKASAANVMVALGDTALLQLAGFVATAFDGGLPCVYVPTTVVSAVQKGVSDQAVLDVSGARGLVRADVRPIFSCIDTDLFADLAPEQWLAGFAAIAQTAFLDAGDFFFWLSDNATALRNRNADAVCEALVRALGFRSQLSFEKEQNGAQAKDCLRYGSDFAGATGLPLAQGMRFSALLSQFKGMISEDVVQAQDALLASLGFIQAEAFSVDATCEALLASADTPTGTSTPAGAHLVLPMDIGRVQRIFIPKDELESCLEVL